MKNLEQVLNKIKCDPIILNNLNWGEPREGHPEGTIYHHVLELEKNLNLVRPLINKVTQTKLEILIWVHDTFKPQARNRVPITHPQSHATLAKNYLETLIGETELSSMIQYHDEPYAIWKKLQRKGKVDTTRLNNLISAINNWETFLIFNYIDNLVPGKSVEPTLWTKNIKSESKEEFKRSTSTNLIFTILMSNNYQLKGEPRRLAF